jgi:hypothetical protein
LSECVIDPCSLIDKIEKCEAEAKNSCIYLPVGCRTAQNCSVFSESYMTLCDSVPGCATYKGMIMNMIILHKYLFVDIRNNVQVYVNIIPVPITPVPIRMDYAHLDVWWKTTHIHNRKRENS